MTIDLNFWHGLAIGAILCIVILHNTGKRLKASQAYVDRMTAHVAKWEKTRRAAMVTVVEACIKAAKALNVPDLAAQAEKLRVLINEETFWEAAQNAKDHKSRH